MRTQVLPSDPAAVKVWAAKVALDSTKKQYLAKMTGNEGSFMPVITKTDLETKPGDEVTTTLVAKLRGKPVEGQEKLEGRVMRLRTATHKMRIDKHRQAVNVGDVMDQKRVNWSIPEQARDRLSDYMAEVLDEQLVMTGAGARGDGDEIQHYEVGYTGFPNAFRTPDAAHLMYWDGTITASNSASWDGTKKFGRDIIEKLVLRAKKQIGGQPDKAVSMQPVKVNGGKHFVYLASPESMYDLRREQGEAGWLAIEKAKVTAIGQDSPLFKGGSVYLAGALIDECQTVVKFGTYGSGANRTVCRNLFLGANAICVAYGTRTQRDNMRFELMEADEDYGEEGVIIVRMIAGFDKPQFNGMDFGLIANDVEYSTST